MTEQPAKSQTAAKKQVTLSIRLSPAERDRLVEAAKLKGCSPARFIKESTLRRSAHVLNVRQYGKFSFQDAAKWLARQLFLPLSFFKEDPETGQQLVEPMDLHELMTRWELGWGPQEEEPEDREGWALVTESNRPDSIKSCGFKRLLELSRMGGLEFWELALEAGTAHLDQKHLGLKETKLIDPDAIEQGK